MARKARRASARRSPARRSARRSASRVTRRGGGRSQILRLVIETPSAQPAMVPTHLGPGGGIVPLVAANLSRKPKF